MKITLFFFSFLLVLAGAIPLVKKDYWTFRVFDYPRMQKLVLSVFLLLMWVTFFYKRWETLDYIAMGALLILTGYLCYQIFPFSPFSQKMVQESKGSTNAVLHILVANVYQPNDAFDKTINLIQKEQPDLFVLVETDQKWADAISVLKHDYPHHMEKPLDNTYGMLLYSKLPLLKQEINYLIDEEIPSFEVDVPLEDGQKVRIYAIHPTPPVPGESLESTERDAEILMVGQKAKEYDKPCVVVGDLNDVGWSYTSELFLKTSGLLDPRRGRGMYSTFHAKYPLLRWPLDHIFVSKHFTLESLKVHGPVNSDHFPISAKLCLNPTNDNAPKTATLDEKTEAKQKVKNGKV
ncbi:endonuclease/exonuclease/phosphatase family protein [Pararhodonellum marinum]|uniref:endonuclease/exonuclease/phosphatase family protein n=1 Tax=Pararhodonellum marinum TaxID=2755358 RepID=UPI00188F4EB5|nr:endonuclease/exonuclease/phosphatase family protein [Pararhodonellum marinum]